MSKHASIASDSISAGEGNHKVFSKEISGKLVVDLLFQRLLGDKELQGFWAGLDIPTITHQQDVMMEIAFGAGLLPEDITYLTEVHKDIMQHHGLTSKHFELYCKHFEATLADPRISTVIPKEKKDEAVKNIKSCAVIFKKK